MRSPRIENKYNLNPSDITKLRILNKEAIMKKPFWRNNVIDAWCISDGVGRCCYGHMNEYWLGIYDDNAKEYAGRIRYSFDCYDGMCSYKFTEFFDFKQIETEADLEIQEKFLERINLLLDEGVLAK